MGFGTAVARCFQKYVKFSGRARRPEYWYFVLFVILLSVVATFIDFGIEGGQPQLNIVSSLVSLGTLLPSLAVAWRRMHDIGRTGWWNFLSVVGLVVMAPAFLLLSTSPEIAQILLMAGIGLSLVLSIIVIVMLASKSQEGPNQFGPPLNPDGTEIQDAEVFA